MGIFDVADPQHAGQNDEVAERIPQVVLSHDEHKRNKGHQQDRHHIAPKHQLRFSFPQEHEAQEQDEQQFEKFRRLETEPPGQRKPTGRIVVRITGKHHDDEQADTERVNINRIFDKQSEIYQGHGKEHRKPQ
ncbi:hypothetical protein D1872_273960 [compost metagenome]